MTMSGIAAMRIHVRMLGRVQSIHGSRARMQVIINVSRERSADPCDFLYVRHSRAHDLLEAAKVLEQRAALRGAEPRYRLQHGFVVASRPFAPMAGNGEAMRLVANALDQPRRG